MLKKNILSETFFVKGSIDKISKIDYQLVKNHILNNYNNQSRYTDNQYWYMNNYLKIPYHQHIQWIYDWIKDHYNLIHGEELYFTENEYIRGLIQQTGENINTHNNVKEWHLEQSPDIDCLLTLSSGKNTSYVVFEYDDGRHKHRRWKEPLKEGQFILFSSDINRCITENENKDLLINLSLHFQRIKMV